MIRLLLILIIVAGAVYAAGWWKKNRAVLDKKKIASAALVALLLLCLVLVATGRAHWLAVVGAGLLAVLQRGLPMLIRLFPFLQHLYKTKQAKAAQPGNQSQVRSDVLLMTLDHDSGQLDGEVLKGSWQGKHLSELDEAQLKALYQYCREQDGESVQLLQAYLNKRFAGQWQYDNAQQEYNSSQAGDVMNRQEALCILGLTEGATNDDIKKAHRKLMQKLHPDHGGSDYLAAKVNEARRVLMGD